jgi:hypothetical protein
MERYVIKSYQDSMFLVLDLGDGKTENVHFKDHMHLLLDTSEESKQKRDFIMSQFGSSSVIYVDENELVVDDLKFTDPQEFYKQQGQQEVLEKLKAAGVELTAEQQAALSGVDIAPVVTPAAKTVVTPRTAGLVTGVVSSDKVIS